MNVRHTTAGAVLFATTLLAGAPAFAQSSQPPAPRVGGDSRFFMRFVEDAGIVPSYWLEGRATWTTNSPAFDPDTPGAGEADYLGISPIFAMNVAEDFEFGARLSLVSRNADNGGSDTGFSDLDLWGKISVVSDPVKISLGLLITAPTGSSSKFLGTGETNIELFGGIRKDFSRITLAGNVGFRVNQDPDFPDIAIEGKNSLLFGAGVLIPAGSKVVLSAEWALETERFEGMKNDSRLMGGAEYRQNESLLFRGAVGGGLSNGAPDFELTGGAVWLF